MVVVLGEDSPRQRSLLITACMAQVGSVWPTAPTLICLSLSFLAGIQLFIQPPTEQLSQLSKTADDIVKSFETLMQLIQQEI
jgi:hypothetical protein